MPVTSFLPCIDGILPNVIGVSKPPNVKFSELPLLHREFYRILGIAKTTSITRESGKIPLKTRVYK